MVAAQRDLSQFSLVLFIILWFSLKCRWCSFRSVCVRALKVIWDTIFIRATADTIFCLFYFFRVKNVTWNNVICGRHCTLCWHASIISVISVLQICACTLWRPHCVKSGKCLRVNERCKKKTFGLCVGDAFARLKFQFNFMTFSLKFGRNVIKYVNDDDEEEGGEFAFHNSFKIVTLFLWKTTNERILCRITYWIPFFVFFFTRNEFRFRHCVSHWKFIVLLCSTFILFNPLMSTRKYINFYFCLH